MSVVAALTLSGDQGPADPAHAALLTPMRHGKGCRPRGDEGGEPWHSPALLGESWPGRELVLCPPVFSGSHC